MIDFKSYGWLRNSILLLMLLFSLLIVGGIGYLFGRDQGYRAGQSDAEQLRGLFTSQHPTLITITNTPLSISTIQAPTPNGQVKNISACESLSVTSNEVLVREAADLNAKVMTALPHDTKVQVVCSSEQMISSVSWVAIIVSRPNEAILTGWIPGQDIGYPPVCGQGRVKPQEINLYSDASEQADVIHPIPQGTEVGIVCDSVRTTTGRSDSTYWVRVKLTLNGDIVLGWTLAHNVL